MWVWLCGALSVWGAFGHFKASSLQKDIAEYKLAQAEVNAEAERLARRVEQAKAEASREVVNAAITRAKVSESRNTNLNAAVGRLRKQLENNSSNSTGTDTATACGVYEQRSELYSRLLAESTELVREGSERTGRLADKTTSLQEWIKRVCLNADH